MSWSLYTGPRNNRFSKADARSLLLVGEDLVVRFAVKREEIFDNAGSRLSLSMDGKAIEIEGGRSPRNPGLSCLPTGRQSEDQGEIDPSDRTRRSTGP